MSLRSPPGNRFCPVIRPPRVDTLESYTVQLSSPLLPLPVSPAIRSIPTRTKYKVEDDARVPSCYRASWGTTTMDWQSGRSAAAAAVVADH